MFKLTKEVIDRLNQVADELFYDYEVIGIRIQEEPFQPGELEHRSHVWVDEEDTGEELNGVSVVRYDSIGQAQSYFGDHAAIIVGNRYTYGEDPGEIVIEDPIVVEVLA